MEEMTEVSLLIDGEEVWARCHPNDADQARQILDLLAQFAAQGFQLNESNSVIVGWSQLSIVRLGPRLYLREPDYLSGNPVGNWIPSLTVTIDIARQQGDLLTPIGLDPDPVVFDWVVMNVPGVFSTDKIYMQREIPGFLGDSGWRIGPLQGSAGAQPTEKTPLYQLLQTRPGIITASAIPKGFLVVMKDNSVEAILDDHDRNILFQPFTQAGRLQAIRRVSDKFG